MYYFAGIDPGFTGSLVILDTDGHVQIIEDAPTNEVTFTKKGKKRTRQEFDLPKMRRILTELKITTCLIEDVAAGSGQGVTSMFRFGHGLGLWEGLLTGLYIPYTKILPAKWKAHFGLINKEKDDARLLAQEMNPTLALFNLKKHHNRADAYLLARYNWEQYVNGNEK